MYTGPLEPPGNVHIIPINSSLLQLWWNEPFSLDLTDHDPDISGYCIDVTNINTGAKIKLNITSERPYNFSGIPGDGEKPYPCHRYKFSISARNVAGLGKSSREATTSFPESEDLFELNVTCMCGCNHTFISNCSPIPSSCNTKGFVFKR